MPCCTRRVASNVMSEYSASSTGVVRAMASADQIATMQKAYLGSFNSQLDFVHYAA